VTPTMFLFTAQLVKYLDLSTGERCYMAHGTRNKFGASIFELEVFRQQMYCIEDSTCNIVGTFWRPSQSLGVPRSNSAPHCDFAPGELCPLLPLVTPLDPSFLTRFKRSVN